LRLVDSNTGEIEVDGERLDRLRGRKLRDFRRHAQLVFQDPYGSLNPRMRVRDVLDEPLRLHTDLQKADRRARIDEILWLVHLHPRFANRYPGELSGGEQQRVGIARAIITEPKLIVLDEPTASLDASIRKGIFRLLVELQDRMNLTYLLISHDLASVWGVADYVAVMYRGQIVEYGSRDEVFLSPLHPYTVALMSAAPQVTLPGAERQARLVLTGEADAGQTTGCRFVARCPIALPSCADERPEIPRPPREHAAACIRVDAVPVELASYRSRKSSPVFSADNAGDRGKSDVNSHG
jgi:oligopeptide/dipeptide ABC transporter ATP-binding protein